MRTELPQWHETELLRRAFDALVARTPEPLDDWPPLVP